MATVLLVAEIVGAAVSVYSAVRAGQAQSAAAKYNKAVAQQNANAATQQADALAAQKHRDTVQRLGAMEASYGASGVTSDSGSVLDVLGDSIRQGTLDQLTAKYNGQLRAAGYSDSSSLDTFQAHYAETSSYMQAAGTALSDSGGIYKDYNNNFGQPASTGGNQL